MTQCRELVERATDLMEHRLGLPTRVRLRVHMLLCAVCRAFYRQLGETVATLEHLDDEPLPDALARGMHAAAGAAVPSDGSER